MTEGATSDPAGFETLESFSKIPAFNRWLYEKISKDVSGNILEIGGGIGNISGFLLDDHLNVSLSDLRGEYCDLLKQKFGSHPHLKEIYELDLSATDFTEKHAMIIGTFDTVIALNVIEHIENDRLAIKNATSLLRDKGKLIILVPAGQWLYNRLDKELGHYRRYSKKSLMRLLKSADLIIQDTRFFNAAAILGWWVTGNILQKKAISPGSLKYYNKLVPLFKMTDKLVSPSIGISVISVGVKNE